MSNASVSRCRSLRQQSPSPVFLWLVAEGVLDVIRARYLDTRTCLPLDHAVQFFSSFFFGWFSQKNSRIVCFCLLLQFFTISLFFVFVSPPKFESVCARAAWWLYYTWYERSGAAYYVKKIKEMVELLLICSYLYYFEVHSFKTGSGR